VLVSALLFIDKTLFDSSLVDSALALEGRDTSLTGRTDLWTDVIALGSKRPIVGYGFGGFWTEARAAYLKEIYIWGPLQSHNGYIEIFVNLGLIGLVLFGFVSIGAFKGAFRQCSLYFDYGLFRIILLIVVMIHNYSEAGFVRPTHLIWFTFLLMAVNVWYKYPPNQEPAAVSTSGG
jgi:exopolysaccharide production protein ExoQ